MLGTSPPRRSGSLGPPCAAAAAAARRPCTPPAPPPLESSLGGRQGGRADASGASVQQARSVRLGGSFGPHCWCSGQAQPRALGPAGPSAAAGAADTRGGSWGSVRSRPRPRLRHRHQIPLCGGAGCVRRLWPAPASALRCAPACAPHNAHAPCGLGCCHAGLPRDCTTSRPTLSGPLAEGGRGRGRPPADSGGAGGWKRAAKPAATLPASCTLWLLVQGWQACKQGGRGEY